MFVWINGNFVERDNARISAFDAGLQHGIGLFETMSAANGVIFRARAHTQRLVDSARILLLSNSLRAEPLAEACALAVRHNEMHSARVRLTVTGGNLGGLPTGRGKTVDPTLLIDVQPPTDYPDAFFENGVMVTIADGRLNPALPMSGHKTLDYWPRIHALQHAAAKTAGETLWFTVSNHLACGSVSNVFLVRDGALVTPRARGEDPEQPLGPPVLPGITRSVILELCAGLDFKVEKAAPDINDLLSADEVFLTNSSWGVLPVVAVETRTIGDGAVGAVTRRLRDGWLDLVEQETSA